MAIGYGLGCIVDAKSYKPDAYWGKGLGISDASNYDLLNYGRFDLNQRSGNSCVLFAHSQLYWVDQQVHGKRKPVLMSPHASYWAARKRRAGGGPIFDLGCRPGDAMEAFKELGWCPWSRWEGLGRDGKENVDTWDLGIINREPPLDVFQAMVDRRWIRDVRVETYGASRLADVQVLIAREKKLVAAGLVVDDTFASWKASHGPWRRTGPAIGRHMVALAAFEPGAVFAIGSYGSSNAEGNVVAIAADVITSDETEPLMYMDIDYTRVPVQ